MVEATFSYQFDSSSNPSSPSMSAVSVTTSSIATVLANSNRLLALKWSVRIIGGLLIVIGGIGNTLSALTLSRKKLRAQVTSIYLIALALSDLGNVFFSVLNFYLVRLDPQQNMRVHSNLACKLHIFFTYYFINLSPTLLVAVSVQRYLAVAKHHYSKRHCTVKNAYIIIGLICFFSIFIQLHWAIFYELQLIPVKEMSTAMNRTIVYRRVCNITSDYPQYMWFRSHMIGYIQWFFFTLCPFVIMLILNSLILKVIASARRIQERINQKNQRKKAKQRNMTIMLLSVSCVFILLTAPASTFMGFGHLFKNLHGPNSQSLWTMFSLIYYANTAANFLLYFLTANVFRQELRVMILSLPGCSKVVPPSARLSTPNAANLTTVGEGVLPTTTTPILRKSQLTTFASLNSTIRRSQDTISDPYQKRNGTELLLRNSISQNHSQTLIQNNIDHDVDDLDSPL
ncbi:unnamed protein product [Adineta ricciae]|uniref:G-protein coupled receptors family 1 profile domain-containing protein n=1 Tax=Adineta ricciae TaxID=249248 RepID=A0A815T397_ADIRI|nr:unnamed protein product [Adineta ricciae]CAF1497733.1 unnamed protein product [Adineta ricciae]